MVRIGTWNLENLYLPGGEFGPRTPAAYDAKLASLAQTIVELEPDVLAVQEVGDPQALDEVAAAVGGTWWIELAAPDGRGIRAGLLSRLPLTGVTQVSAFPERLQPVLVDDDGTTLSSMGRPALAATVQVGNTAIELVSCHLKSKLLTFGDGRFAPRDEGERARAAVYALHRRAAEAATVRTRATATLGSDGDRAVVVLGDLNDEPGAATTELLLGPPGSEIGTAGFAQPDRGDAQRLWNLAPLIPEEQRFSRVFRGRRQLIDHLLLSAALVQRVQAGGVTTGIAADTPSVTEDPGARRDAPGSDHRPVFADLDL